MSSNLTTQAPIRHACRARSSALASQESYPQSSQRLSVDRPASRAARFA
jgi:hypothetical protein